jgi:hypothetical protein
MALIVQLGLAYRTVNPKMRVQISLEALILSSYIYHTMTDSKLKSATEAITNLIPGFAIAYLSNMYVLPLYAEGIAASDSFTMLQIGVWYTIISLARSYVLRRVFERLGEKENFYTLIRRIR